MKQNKFLDKFESFIRKIDDINIKSSYLIFILTGLLILRFSQIDVVSFDFHFFLEDWIIWLREHDGILGIRTIYENSNCNYYLPYMLLLGMFSYLPISNLAVIKLISIIFDYVAAYFIYKIISHYSSKNRGVIISLVYLISPFILVNGATWGQCDSIFTSFILMSIYYLVCKNDIPKCLLFFFISFTFKQQAIFFSPVLFILLINKELKIKDFKLCAIYGTMLLLLSAFIFKGDILYPLKMSYFSQYESSELLFSLFIPNIYTVVDYMNASFNISLSPEQINEISKYILAVFVVFIIYFSFKIRKYFKNTNSKNYLLISALFTMLCPFLMPLMHDRYYYLGYVMLMVYAFSNTDEIKYTILSIAFMIINTILIFNLNWFNIDSAFAWTNPYGKLVNIILAFAMILFMTVFVKQSMVTLAENDN